MSGIKRFYPVVDLFAGPGGLGEGFALLSKSRKSPAFRSVISIERDEHAHNTLTLRHFFRNFTPDRVPEEYYEYLAGNIDRDELTGLYPRQWKDASDSSRRISLGGDTHEDVRRLIAAKLKGFGKWALVGGPPCQAYSLVGRSRMMNSPDFEKDERHFLYREYLKIIIDHRPPVFVMENVKGLLSSRVNGELVVHKILKDLSSPIRAIRRTNNGLKYRLYSLSTPGLFRNGADPKDFIVKADEFGVPQARHRMFIVGIRDDIDVMPASLQPSEAPTVGDVIGKMPRLRSGISRGQDSPEAWRGIIENAAAGKWFEQLERQGDDRLLEAIERTASRADTSPHRTCAATYKKPEKMTDWFYDERLEVLSSHAARSHMPTDLHRYMFAACYAKVHHVSPKLKDYPRSLLPKHQSARSSGKSPMFEDRFRVQLPDRVSTTVTSHISKDGHYFIHYDPAQCRSLTVREAARLQTFPDNYFFEGPRTAQYHQIGNAVPPFLARQIAEIIREVLDAMKGP